MSARIETAIKLIQLQSDQQVLLNDKVDLLEKQVSMQHDLIISLKDLLLSYRSQKLEKDK